MTNLCKTVIGLEACQKRRAERLAKSPPSPGNARPAKSYRGLKRNDFFGRKPVGNTNPYERFSFMWRG